MKKLIIFCFIIISAFIFSGCQLSTPNTPSNSETFNNPSVSSVSVEVKPPQSPVIQPLPPASQAAAVINFSHEGETINWDSRTETYTQDWTLLWGKPGNPAVVTKLIFNAGSLCNLGQGYEVCDKNKLNNGDRARVDGQGTETEVIVVKLEKI